jgi:DNA-binding response OmpR family regulator
MAAGASDYLTKPFQPADLLRRVRRVLHRDSDPDGVASGDQQEADAGSP